MDKDEEILAKLDEILGFLRNRKPEVDEKLEHVGNVCDLGKRCQCQCKCCTTGECECECYKDKQ
ncbi:MAG: hypothetical protein Q7S37_04955 [bacterium]|nr:hypothetical protein [bacterium]